MTADDPTSGGGSDSVFRPRTGFTPIEPDPIAPHLRPGDTVGDFRLTQLIGRGGMGAVWIAEEQQLNRTVALKLIRPERIDDQAIAMFQREARAGGRLSHPGIVGIHSYGESDGIHFISQVLVGTGHNLANVLSALRELDAVPEGYYAEVAELVIAVAEAMQAAHDAGVIHRDLKPQNILIDDEGKPRITDFGLARIAGEESLSGRFGLLGTYHYMSPEQAMGKSIRIDHRTDLFSLGVVLYELLTLKRPFDGDTEQQILTQITFDDPPPPRSERSRVPLDLSVICMKALEKNRDYRYGSMRDFAADMRRFLGNEPIVAKPPGPLRRMQKWMVRHPTKSVALGLGAAALVVISGLLLRTLRAEEDARQSATIAQSKAFEAEQSAALAQVREREADQARQDEKAQREEADRQRREAEKAGENERLQREEADERRQEAEAAQQREAEERARAEREKETAESERERANAEFQNVLRLSDIKKLRDLIALADELWPVHPDLVPEMERWLEEAETLIANLPQHRTSLAEVRSRSTSPAEATDPAEVEFEEAQDDWWYEALFGLVADLAEFSDGDEDQSLVTRVRERLNRSRTIEQRSIRDHEETWDEAIVAIMESEHYDGLRLSEQLGLVPLREDPDSGLWEFWVVESGERPGLSPTEGHDHWLITGETGIVLVLLPGGTFTMGAQADDPDGANYDERAQPDETPMEVTLAPFFLSKYELTQGQWYRIMGTRPSYYAASGLGGDEHPVEQVDWGSSLEAMSRLGLLLPTEAQWEYGARGGTATPWWCGNEAESIGRLEAGNLFDARTRREQPQLSWSNPEDWEDHFVVHAPVGSFAANGFGLQDVIGNVFELCQDAYEQSPSSVRPGDGLRAGEVQNPPRDRVSRGGGFSLAAISARSAARNASAPSLQYHNLGVRPAARVRD